MKYDRAYILVVLIFVLSREFSLCQTRPNYPYVQKGVCPFECCQFGKWKTHTRLNVYSNEGDSSHIKFTIAPGDSFEAITGNVHMIKPGIVIVTKATGNLSPGDTIYTLSYTGEGNNDIWRHGEVENVEIFWQTDDEPIDSSTNINDPKWSEYSGVMVERPLMIWWVRISFRDGRSGWLMLINKTDNGFKLDERIDGMDSCD